MKSKIYLTHQSFSHQLCSLTLTHSKQQTEIDMRLFSSHLTTRTLPKTLNILKALAPTVLRTRCHNNLHLPFKKEVIDTEIGHLFEHLIIDQMSRCCSDDRTFYGVTEWNWHEHPRGTFKITLSVGNRDQKLLYNAIAWSYNVLEQVLNSTPTLRVIDQPTRSTETIRALSI